MPKNLNFLLLNTIPLKKRDNKGTMKIEIINMYFSKEDLERDLFEGTAHIFLVDFNMNLRGVYFKKRKDFWYVALPTLAYTHGDSKKKMKCPFLSFDDKEQNKRFQNTIKELMQRELEIRLMQKTLQLIT